APVLDDGDIAPVNFPGSAIRSEAQPVVAPTSRPRTPDSSRPRVGHHVEKSAICIPVAADGTAFNPGLAWRGGDTSLSK
ncbi:MAG: hypothetical protein MJH10_18060, partial [Epibacterium sp.]|nr:hypothetical protein [Epibacterium sp.]